MTVRDFDTSMEKQQYVLLHENYPRKGKFQQFASNLWKLYCACEFDGLSPVFFVYKHKKVSWFSHSYVCLDIVSSRTLLLGEERLRNKQLGQLPLEEQST